MKMGLLECLAMEENRQDSGRIKVTDLNTLLTCVICRGYFIDATTISECLHSFCRTCIVRYLQTNKCCPICEAQVHKAKPLLSIRADQSLQDIVYKVVPGLFKDEMRRRRDFYSSCNFKNGAAIPVSSEKRGDVMGCERLIFTPEDIISISLEYCSPNITFPLLLHAENTDSLEGAVFDATPKNKVHRRYFQCPGAVTVRHLKRLLSTKYALTSKQEIDILYMHDQLREEYTLTDLAYIYSWRRNGPLRLFYKFHDTTCRAEDIKYYGPCIIPAIPDPMTVASSILNLVNTSPEPSVAMAPSSQTRHPSPPASPQMATEPDNSKVANPRSASMQNGYTTNCINDTPRAGKRSEKPKTRTKDLMHDSDSFSRNRRSDGYLHSKKLEVVCPYNNGRLDKCQRNRFKRGMHHSYKSHIFNGDTMSIYESDKNTPIIVDVPNKSLCKADAVRLLRKNSL